MSDQLEAMPAVTSKEGVGNASPPRRSPSPRPESRKRSRSPRRALQRDDDGRERSSQRDRGYSPRRDRARNQSRSPRNQKRDLSHSPRRGMGREDNKRQRDYSPRRHRSRSPRFQGRRDDYRRRDPDSERSYGRDRQDRDRDYAPGGRGDGQGAARAEPDRASEGEGRKDDSRPRGPDEKPRQKKKLGAFSYKDKRRDGERDGRDSDRGGGSFRGYKDRETSPRRRERDVPKAGAGDTTKPPKRAPAAASSVPQEFITVYVNNRLGAKTKVPCMPSDTIKQFKVFVAALIGQPPNRIRLQRQGQRRLDDRLTLWDYEISNGVSLDLEIGTGDD